MHVVAQRVEWACHNQCGHCTYTGPIGTLKVYKSAFSRGRSCLECGGALSARVPHQQKFHAKCRDARKRREDHETTVWRKAIGYRRKAHTPSLRVIAAKEADLSGIRRGA